MLLLLADVRTDTMVTTVSSRGTCVGTGFYFPRTLSSVTEQTESTRNFSPARSSGSTSSCTSPGRRSRSDGLGPNRSPAAVALHRQLMLQRAIKAAAADSCSNINTAAAIMDPPGLHQPVPLQLPGPAPSFCSSGSLFDSSGSFAAFTGAEGLPLSPCHSGSNAFSPLGAVPGPFVSAPASLAPPQQQYYAVTGRNCFDAQAQNLALLDQQEAEINAALMNLITLKQQLAAAATPQQQQVFLAAPPALPVSAVTAALGQQLPVAAAPCSPPSPAAAQLQLASMQAQQQQLYDVESQLQAQLAAQLVRALGL